MSDLHVVFQVADAEYAVPASEVLQLESYAGATPVPGAPAYVRGLVQVRGHVVPVIDLRRRFGHPDAPSEFDSRLIVMRQNERTVGLLVDRSREVVQLGTADVRPPPDVVRKQARNFVRGIASIGDRLFMLIDFDEIVGEETGNGP